jgi:hypothetical protein
MVKISSELTIEMESDAVMAANHEPFNEKFDSQRLFPHRPATHRLIMMRAIGGWNQATALKSPVFSACESAR